MHEAFETCPSAGSGRTSLSIAEIVLELISPLQATELTDHKLSILFGIYGFDAVKTKDYLLALVSMPSSGCVDVEICLHLCHGVSESQITK